jgi:hypothetical protein
VPGLQGSIGIRGKAISWEVTHSAPLPKENEHPHWGPERKSNDLEGKPTLPEGQSKIHSDSSLAKFLGREFFPLSEKAE